MKHIFKKLCALIITLFVVSFLAFLAFQCIPADPASIILGTEATPERLAALRQQLGLNDPVAVRYFRWVGEFLFGDMGTSYIYSLPVRQMLADKVPVTLALTGISFLLVVLVSVPLGIWQTKHAHGAADRAVTVAGQIFMAIPPFLTGIVFTLLFGLLLKLFIPGKFVSPKESVAGFLGYLIFPAVAIAIPKIAMTVRMLRTSILSEMREDYVRTAYSRGLTSGMVLARHVLRNALIPVVTFLAMTLADIVAGSVIIERVFVIPGMGQLLLASISNRDYPVVQAIVVIIAFIVVFANFLADVLCQYIDPRIRMS